jgi:hypothetical protein
MISTMHKIKNTYTGYTVGPDAPPAKDGAWLAQGREEISKKKFLQIKKI